MALWLIDSWPTDFDPELFVCCDNKADADMTDGFYYDADCEYGPTLFVDCEALCSFDKHFSEFTPYERCCHMMYHILKQIQRLQIHTILMNYYDLVMYAGLERDIKAQVNLIKEFRALMERLGIDDFYLIASRVLLKDAFLNDVSAEPGTHVLEDSKGKQEDLSLDEDDEDAPLDPKSRLKKELDLLIAKESPPPGTYRKSIEEPDSSSNKDDSPRHQSPNWETNVSFGIELDRLIQLKRMQPGEFVRRANISRQTMNNLRKPDFTPQKYTALACVVALELNISEANRLLGFAGYTLSSSLKSDVIISFYISKGIFDIDRINVELFHANQHQLGCRG